MAWWGGKRARHGNANVDMVEGEGQLGQGHCCGAPGVLGLQIEEPKLGQHCFK